MFWGRKRREIKERKPRRNSNARRGRSHRSVTVTDVGYEGHHKRWAEELGSPPQKGQRGMGSSPIFSRQERRELQMDERLDSNGF